jgi:GH15 family glucan-1,4-alpha-glucosidase
MVYQPIESYGLIGDMHTVALVSNEASIDYMCLPHFDSPTVFAALLDDEKGGRFRISAVMVKRQIRQFYIPDTNILMTRFLGVDGVAEVIDFMPTPEEQHAHRLVRRVKCVRGRVPFEMLCAPRFDYARAEHALEIDGRQALFRPSHGHGRPLQLHASVPLDAAAQKDARARFTLGPGEEAAFVLEVAQDAGKSMAERPGYPDEAFRTTLRYWRGWMSRSTYSGRWAQAVNRSVLAIKLLTSAPCGSLAAAATFGLPESLRGERNWDYRYTWIRDASLTAATLINIGFHNEARAFVDWILARYRQSEDAQLQIMYGIDGRCDLTEHTLDHLDGYMGSRPVRVGNGAYSQLQLDIYGELLFFLERYDAEVEPIYNDLWMYVQQTIGWVCKNWDREDEGVWEVRGGKRKFLYSRLMDWVALDRAVRIAERRSLPAPLQHWRSVRDAIHDEIYQNFWDSERAVFVQYRGSSVLDASCLLMPISGFIAPRDSRWLSTLDAVGRELVDDSLVYRYRTDKAASDGLAGSEGTFSMCTFWYVECLALAGRIEEARLIFEKMLHYAGQLGFYGEELGPTGEHLGNYPQAFTHLGLVGAARSLDWALDRAAGAHFGSDGR